MGAEHRSRVVWAEAAVRDLEEIVAFVAAESPGPAERVLRGLRAKVASLEVSPHRGRIVPELGRLGLRTWRELVVPAYRLVYRASSDAVIVLGVFDGRRDLEDILLERLLRET